MEQFWKVLVCGLKSTPEERAKLSGIAMRQRFPVSEWEGNMEKLYTLILRGEDLKSRPETSTDWSSPPNTQTDWLRSRGVLGRIGSSLQLLTRKSESSLESMSAKSSLTSMTTKSSPATSTISSITSRKREGKSYATKNTNSNKPVIVGVSKQSVFLLNHADEQSSDDSSSSTGYSSIAVSDLIVPTNEIDMKLLEKKVKICMDIPPFTDQDNVLFEYYNSFVKQPDFGEAKISYSKTIHFAFQKAQEDFVLEKLRERLDHELLEEENALLRFSKSFMQKRIFGWAVYSVILCFCQLISSSIFQLVLLTGGWSPNSSQIALVSVVYFASSMVWWCLYKCLPLRHCLTYPIIIYALAVFLAGIPVQNPVFTMAVVLLYAFASGAGFLFFTMNFAHEDGITTEMWIWRSGIFEGIRQLLTLGLWYWYHSTLLSNPNPELGKYAIGVSGTVSCAILSMVLFVTSILVFTGLPNFYNQNPPQIPQFWYSFKNRALPAWFLIFVFLQTFWLSAAYGRNYMFVWIQPFPTWGVMLTAIFFIAVWYALIWIIGIQSRKHSWFLPVLSSGLVAPSWMQISWSASFIGYAFENLFPGAILVSISMWFWLGILSGLQNIGFLIMLFQVYFNTNP